MTDVPNDLNKLLCDTCLLALKTGMRCQPMTIYSQALSCITQGQFRDYQIHFVKQCFGSPGKVVDLADQTKLPSLPQKLAPQFFHLERRTGVLSEEKRIARTTTASRAPARQKDATMGADRAILVRVP